MKGKGPRHSAAQPPSTGRSTPVDLRARSEARKQRRVPRFPRRCLIRPPGRVDPEAWSARGLLQRNARAGPQTWGTTLCAENRGPVHRCPAATMFTANLLFAGQSSSAKLSSGRAGPTWRLGIDSAAWRGRGILRRCPPTLTIRPPAAPRPMTGANRRWIHVERCPAQVQMDDLREFLLRSSPRRSCRWGRCRLPRFTSTSIRPKDAADGGDVASTSAPFRHVAFQEPHCARPRSGPLRDRADGQRCRGRESARCAPSDREGRAIAPHPLGGAGDHRGPCS